MFHTHTRKYTQHNQGPIDWHTMVQCYHYCTTSFKLELRFCSVSCPVHGVSEIRDSEDLWQWSRLEVKLNAFRRSTIPQKQFIIIIVIIKYILTPPVMYSEQLSVLHWIIQWYQKITFHNVFSFKKILTCRKYISVHYMQ